MLPGAVAYTWLGYAGRSAAEGNGAALRYGLLGLGGLAMIAFLPRLFRRFRASEPAWIDTAELQRRLTAGDHITLIDVRQPEEYTAPPGHLPAAINVPLADLPSRTPELAGRKQPILQDRPPVGQSRDSPNRGRTGRCCGSSGRHGRLASRGPGAGIGTERSGFAEM
jgi:rhodanese-related sulfurtransferase